MGIVRRAFEKYSRYKALAYCTQIWIPDGQFGVTQLYSTKTDLSGAVPITIFDATAGNGPRFGIYPASISVNLIDAAGGDLAVTCHFEGHDIWGDKITEDFSIVAGSAASPGTQYQAVKAFRDVTLITLTSVTAGAAGDIANFGYSNGLDTAHRANLAIPCKLFNSTTVKGFASTTGAGGLIAPANFSQGHGTCSFDLNIANATKMVMMIVDPEAMD